MRALVIAAVVVIAAIAAPARADTVVTVGATFDARAVAPTYSAAGNADASFLGGARLTFGFESPAIAMPPLEGVAYRLGLVPELFAGFLSDSTHAEGYVGAGVRAELAFASNRRAVNLRVAFYTAARAIVISDDHDPAVELVVGEWLSRGPDRYRFGWEAGAMIRPRAEAAPDDRELDAVVSLYVSRR
jgi:hypothetical protein